jgi:hypothetical protein
MRYEYRALPGPHDHIVDVHNGQFVVAVPEHEHDAIPYALANLAQHFTIEVIDGTGHPAPDPARAAEHPPVR